MKFLIAVIILSQLYSCNNGSGNNPKTKTDSVFSAKNIPGMPPTRVTGSFIGEQPCKNCKGIEVLLQLTDTSFLKIQNFKQATDKTHSLNADKGKCTQDSGIIRLYGKNNMKETYKIISRDSLILLDPALKGRKNDVKYYLIRHTTPPRK